MFLHLYIRVILKLPVGFANCAYIIAYIYIYIFKDKENNNNNNSHIFVRMKNLFAYNKRFKYVHDTVNPIPSKISRLKYIPLHIN